ncbi:MAG: GNAT family N-acetyltransferase [Magnetococcales bacterium]|nr:GNAT family N-acetyltransferase [Magnetococcales bacterium]
MNKPKKLEDWRTYLKSGARIFLGSNAACPHTLMSLLLKQASHFKDVEVVHILTLGGSPWAGEKYRHSFKVNSLFLGPGSREAVASGVADYTPCFLSEIPSLFKEGILPIDVALIQVSPPDSQGYCSLGVSVDVVSSACRSARVVIAQINRAMPRTFGRSFIPFSMIDAYIEVDEPILELPAKPQDEITLSIGHNVAMLIEDGSTLQMGIGRIPDAVLQSLQGHHRLGIHTEMFSDGLVDLMEKGVVDNSRKTLHAGKVITSFCMGSKRLYDFVHENPHVEFHPSEYTNHPAIISQNDRMIAINSAIEVDLSGQVVADSVGSRLYSGIGGQVDFIRGAAQSKNGCPIIALPSTAKNGTVSRIVPSISPGSGVVTSRGDVHYVVTEYGIASLRGKSIRERALELIQIAHPDFREELLRQVRTHYWVPDYQVARPTRVVELGDSGMIKLKMKQKKFFLRPLRASDERILQEFFYSHTQETLMLRYRYGINRMSREKAYTLVNVDQTKDLALCLVRRRGPKERIHAVGRYYHIEQGNYGEVAFVVRESSRKNGLADELLKKMIAIARIRKLSRLVALVRTDNKPMLKVLKKNGFIRGPSEDPMEIFLELVLEQEPAAEEVNQGSTE